MRIIYWNTSCLEPEIEAVSKEVFGLAESFRPSWIFAVNRYLRCSFSLRKRCLGFNPRWHLLYRLLIPLLERRCDVNHVYGSSSPWPFSSALGRKPIVLTIAFEAEEPDVAFLTRCSKIIVQTQECYTRVLDVGIEPEKVELLFAPVDLTRFQAETPRELSKSPTILFATSPRTREEMNDRGVNLMLEAAAMRNSITWRMLYRQWRSNDTAYEATERLVRERQLRNIQIHHGNVDEMLLEYQSADFTIVPFIHAGGGKPCPNSMVEGMACGLPVLISAVSPMAEFVNHHGCGVVFQPNAESLCEAFDMACCRYASLSQKSLEVASRYFSLETYLQRMSAIYDVLPMASRSE